MLYNIAIGFLVCRLEEFVLSKIVVESWLWLNRQSIAAFVIFLRNSFYFSNSCELCMVSLIGSTNINHL